MLDDVVFAAEMTLLEDRFGRRALTTETKVRYYEFLNQNLTTQEFRAAAREIFNRDQFWPSPQRFVEAVRGNAKQLASSEWQLLLAHMRNGQHNPSELSATGRQALRAAGGFKMLLHAENDFALNNVRSAFQDAFQQAAEQPRETTPELPEAAALTAEVTT